MLGLYGNTALETPAFDRVASEGITFDFAFSHSCDLPAALDRMMADPNGDNGQSITDWVDGRTVMVTDCQIAAQSATKAHFETIVDVRASDTGKPAASIAETHAAEFFSASIQAVEELSDGDLLWLHFSGLSQVWDAPREMRLEFTGEDDPEPYLQTAPPQMDFDPNQDDPDILVSIQQAMTAQVAVIDELLDVFLTFIQQHAIANTAHLIVSSPRGFSLGGGGKIGIGASLESESVHVPLLIKPTASQGQFAGWRSHSLVQNSLVFETLKHLCGEGAVDGISIEAFLQQQSPVLMEQSPTPIFLAGRSERAIQNHQWKLIAKMPDGETDTAPVYGEVVHRLYVKPDDRWDVNDVSARCPRVVDELSELLQPPGE